MQIKVDIMDNKGAVTRMIKKIMKIQKVNKIWVPCNFDECN